MSSAPGRQRVIIEKVEPDVDAGRFSVKRVLGDVVHVSADIFADGHDALSAVLRYRFDGDSQWKETPLRSLVNDRWEGEFTVERLGQHRFTVAAWVDAFQTWQRDLKKRLAAQQNVTVDLQIGAALVEQAAARASGDDRKSLLEKANRLRNQPEFSATLDLAVSDELAALMRKHPDRRFETVYGHEILITVDSDLARFSAWYEMFPRSASEHPGRHGTFADCELRLPYLASLGFNVLYLPPIHPIGHTFRKGKNNALTAGPDDVGSPWAIGAPEGGHKAILPDLGTAEDFRRLVASAREHGLEVALDIAFQCSPDHPYVTEHPQWFRHRPDGSIQYAENPPKKYQDIYPLNFETDDWQALWDELTGVVLHWANEGVRVFRVDNPHTKSFHFWEYLIGKVKRQFPETIFLSEAFTRPKVMYYLAKLGFTQSYTYFAWRTGKQELTEYLTELTQTQVKEFFRPNFWPNTPDILTEQLQFGGRAAFMSRLVLAATLTASYGIYGPAYEHCIGQAREPHSEEYLDSEKYQIKHWDLHKPDSLAWLLAKVNQIRLDNPALHTNERLRFHPVDNDRLICYSKQTADARNVVVTVVNLDPYYTHSGFVDLPLESWGLSQHEPYQMHDLIDDARYVWTGGRNYVELNPQHRPAHIFRLRRRVPSDGAQEYYL